MNDLFVALVIGDRPKITVYVDPKGYALIKIARIDEDFERVDREAVTVPWEDLPAVIEALQKIVDDNGIE